VIGTDVDGVYAGWGTPAERLIRRATPEEPAGGEFAEGSTGPKVEAACLFAEQTGGRAHIGSITETEALRDGEAGAA
jgi:carbamate kinase